MGNFANGRFRGMGGNSLGRFFTLTTFGESHSDFVGGVVEGFSAGVRLDVDFVASELERRKPKGEFSTLRREADCVEFVSGLENGVTLGTPLAFLIRNSSVRKSDYSNLQTLFRPSHGDFTYYEKYGIVSSSGGGRASARETAARVVGGALAKQFLKPWGVNFSSRITFLAGVDVREDAEEARAKLQEAKAKGDSVGGKVECRIEGVPAGLGEPVFDKLSAMLAHAEMSIPSAKSFELGDGLESCNRLGSEDIDHWKEGGGVLTNHSGGIQGGISNGEPIVFSVGFKPAATIAHLRCKDRGGKVVEVENNGRHDTAPVLRAPVIVEAMAALVIADFMKMNKINQTL